MEFFFGSRVVMWLIWNREDLGRFVVSKWLFRSICRFHVDYLFVLNNFGLNNGILLWLFFCFLGEVWVSMMFYRMWIFMWVIVFYGICWLVWNWFMVYEFMRYGIIWGFFIIICKIRMYGCFYFLLMFCLKWFFGNFMVGIICWIVIICFGGLLKMVWLIFFGNWVLVFWIYWYGFFIYLFWYMYIVFEYWIELCGWDSWKWFIVRKGILFWCLCCIWGEIMWVCVWCALVFLRYFLFFGLCLLCGLNMMCVHVILKFYMFDVCIEFDLKKSCYGGYYLFLLQLWGVVLGSWLLFL